MRYIKTLLLSACVLVVPVLCQADTFYLTTSNVNSNDHIDNIDTTVWYAPTGITLPSEPGVNYANFLVTAFTPTFDWYLGGGDFVMKKEGATDNVPVIFSLYLDDTLSAPVATVSIPNSGIPNGTPSYVAFHFASAYHMVTGNHYLATLTSTSDNNGPYFIKSPGDFTIQNTNNEILAPPPAGPDAPEPGTWVLMASGLALAVTSRLRRRKA
jgi:hypothetical protein